MINIQKRLNELNIQFELLGEIRDGETSKTYLGKFENKKAIFKLFNLKNLNMKTNRYLDLTITNQLIKNNLFPKILFLSKEHDLLIYEYISSSKRLSLRPKFIKQIGIKLSKAHSIKLPNQYISFKSQLNNYEKILLEHPKRNIVKKAIKLFKDIPEDKSDLVFSHNDLNPTNILFNNDDVYFIDWEYASINSRYYDLSKIINSYNLNILDINNFFVHYGLDTDNNTFKIINYWNLLDKYLELIWSLVINKIYCNYFSINFIENLEAKIEVLETKLDNKGYK
tara:strand:- start:178 stop:1023 length:846 start_codon:yes stop_codon:yes gene_type:complete